MKKLLLGAIAILSLFIITACGGLKTKTVDLTDYIEVNFEGKDTVGAASFEIKEIKAVADVHGWEVEEFESKMGELQGKDMEKAKEINELFSGYSIELDKTTDLKNGDTVTATVSVNEAYTYAFKEGKKEFTVSGLEELEVITAGEVEKHIIVDFVGADGRGVSRMENTLSGELSSIDFYIENDRELSNGEEAALLVNEENRTLADTGYRLADDFNVTYDVKGLTYYPASASEIKNLKDLDRMILEEMEQKYPKDREYDFGSRNVLKEEVALYRQFTEDNNSERDYGTYIKLYRVTVYRDKEALDNKDVESEFIMARGFSSIQLDEDGNVNVTVPEVFSSRKDSSYSLETIQQIYEGEGFEVVKSE